MASSNISNFNRKSSNHGKNLVDFLPHNNKVYSQEYHTALSILSHDVAEAEKYLKERRLFRNDLFPDFTSKFHENLYLNTIFDHYLTEDDISRLNKIFNYDIRELEHKNELPFFPHNKNENNVRVNGYSIPYPPGIIEQGDETRTNCMGICYTDFVSKKTRLSKISNSNNSSNIVYMTINSSTKWEYWKQCGTTLTELKLNEGKKITPGTYTTTQLREIFSNF